MFRLSLLSLVLVGGLSFAADPPKLSLLFLGDNAGHQPVTRFRLLQPVLAKRNIQLTYTDTLDDINLENLNKYDGLVIYANQGRGKPEHVKAILDYTASGKGFIPLHCASYCFIDDADYVALVGGQFRSHTTGVFRVKDVQPDHPIMKDFSGFESWDETYLHTKHNTKDRTVLETRAEKDLEEPWTWVRTHGKGRVFYTAWGHDQRTWSNPGFHNLVERGIRWACQQEPSLAGAYVDAPKMKPVTGKNSDFESIPAKVPFYPPSKQWGVIADPINKMQKPLTPEKSMTHYTMPQDFEMKLFASEEQFGGGKPICMTWDERGRLWVALTYDYPNELKRDGNGRDKIVILEDTDGDGKADKITTFAEKLSIPTSLLCVRGGVLVHSAPNTLFLKDTDGDGKADVKQVLFTGWGTDDTHAGPSNLRYGFDNWIYGMVGYSGFDGTVNGEKVSFRSGLYRFKLEATKGGELQVTKLEYLRSTSNNSWGAAFNEDGELFGSTANGCVLVHMPIPNRYYEKVKGFSPGVLPPIALDNRYHPITEKVRQVDWHGGFTSAAGCAIYTARNYPPEYWNKTAFVSDPTGHLTATFSLQATGTDYIARYGWNLVAADDEWAAPIDAQVGPDGNVWVLDWYNFIVQHNPTPAGFKTGKGNAYETELRDKKYGRVYRMVYTKAKTEKSTTLADANTAALVEALKSDNLFWRLAAQRIILEKGDKSVIPALAKLFDNPGGSERGALHAVHILSELGMSLQTETKEPIGLHHPSAAVRKAVLATLPKTAASVAVIVKSKLLDDTDPSVQLAALLALADLPQSSEAGPVLAQRLAKLDPFTERNLGDATLMASVAHGPEVLKSLKPIEKWSREGLAALERVAVNYAAKGGDGLSQVIAAVAGSPVADAVIAGLSTGWPVGKNVKISEKDEADFAKVLPEFSPTSRGRLLKLASTMGMKGLEAQLGELARGLLTVIADSKATDAARLDAAKQVMEFRPSDEAAATALVSTLSDKSSPEFALGMLEALSTSRAKSIGTALVAKLEGLPTVARPAALRLILNRPENAKAFLDAVEKRELRFDLLALDQKTALATHPDASIADRAKKLLAQGGGLPDPDRQRVIEDFKTILKVTGNVGLGKKAFTQHCAKCHKHSGEGAQIGPDLTGFAVHPKEEILIHVLDPSRSVEGNYKAYTATLFDGRVIQGLLAAQSKTTVELLDAENKRHAIAREDLEKLAESKKSLMPEGFEKTMTREEFTNLLEFLTQKGKFVPIPLDKYATVVTTKGMFFDDDGDVERLIFKDWKPKEFAGVPFSLTDPQGDKIKNAIMLNGPNGVKAPKMPKTVTLPCNTKAKALHFLSGVGGWNFPSTPRGSLTMTVRLTYADDKTEDHQWKNGVHFADYISKVDVPESKFAFALRGQQIRYLSVTPKRTGETIKTIELIKGTDASAPVVMAVTIETE